MKNSPNKRGEPGRQLDAMLERAISRLEQHMSEQGISQQSIAKASGIDQGRISKILARLMPEVSFYVMVRVLHGAGLQVDWAVMAPPKPAQDNDRFAPLSSVRPGRQ